MGKARIVSHIGAGKYNVKKIYDVERIKRALETLARDLASVIEKLNAVGESIILKQADIRAALVTLNSAISTYNSRKTYENEQAIKDATRNLNILNSDLGELQRQKRYAKSLKIEIEKRIEYLTGQDIEEIDAAIWCADLSDGQKSPVITPGTEVGTIDVLRDGRDESIIRPAFVSADYDSGTDGIMQDIDASTPAGAFVNTALLIWAQKWNPEYRTGTITAIDTQSSQITVALDDALTKIVDSAYLENVNLDEDYQSRSPLICSVEYMDCDVGAFAIGDEVVVSLADGWASPKVIGFVHDPKGCPTAEFLGTPHSDSDNLGIHRFFKDAGDWTAETTTLDASFVDWRGAGEVLTWKGPFSRYWYFGSIQLATEIWRNGVLWTNAPYQIHGASIREVAGTKFLNAITWQRNGPQNFQRIYTRVFAEEYDNDDPYDPDTNPLGWQLLHTWEADVYWYLATPMFMNASGTEGSFLIGSNASTSPFDKRYKITIASDHSVTVDEYAQSGGTGSEDTTSSTTIAFSRSVLVGTLSDPEDQCSSVIEEVVEPLCGCGASDHTLAEWEEDGSTSSLNTKTYTMTDSIAVVACDYIGDVEALARLEVLGSWSDAYDASSYIHTVHDTKHCPPDCATPILNWYQTGSASGHSIFGYSIPQGYYLVFDDQAIPLDIDDSSSEYLNTATVPDSGTVTVSISEVHRKRYLQYLDIRNKTVIYACEDRSVSKSGEGPAGNIPLTITGGTTHAVRIYVNGEEQDVFSYFEDEGGVGVSTYDVSPYHTCPMEPASTSSENSDQTWVDQSRFITYYTHPRVKGTLTVIDQSTVFGDGGIIFTSFEVSPTSDGVDSWPLKGWFNLLDDIDPISLFPSLTGDNKRVWAVGVLS